MEPSIGQAPDGRFALRKPAGGVFGAKKWNPYVAGVGIGLLGVFTMLAMDRTLGTSTTYVHLAGLVESLFAPARVVGPDANPYYAKEITDRTPMFDWQFLLVIGVFAGAWLSSWLSGDRTKEDVPALWAWRFGSSRALRYGAAFVFGLLMMFGARMAGGCTSGHAISGGMQLALSSWVFLVAFFASGIATAFALFGVEGRRHVRG